MTKKDFEYYKNKTKQDEARRKKKGTDIETRMTNGANMAYFFTLGYRHIINSVLRTILIIAIVINLIVGGIAFISHQSDVDVSLFILFTAINVIMIFIATMMFWRRGIYVVAISVIVLSLFAAFMPFYEDECSRCSSCDCVGEKLNYYGAKIGE